MSIDRIKEAATLAAESRAAWKQSGSPADLAMYFRQAARVVELNREKTRMMFVGQQQGTYKIGGNS